MVVIVSIYSIEKQRQGKCRNPSSRSRLEVYHTICQSGCNSIEIKSANAMIFASYTSKFCIFTLFAIVLSGCSYSATVHRYGAPSLEAEIVASDPNTLVIKDVHGESYEVPTRTVTDVEHPGTGWIIAGAVVGGIGVIPALFVEDDIGSALGGTYIGIGAAIAFVGALPYIHSRMNASGADLRSGVKLVPGTDMPIRRVNEGRTPRGPATRP